MEVLYHGIKTRYAYDFPLCFPHELIMSLIKLDISLHTFIFLYVIIYSVIMNNKTPALRRSLRLPALLKVCEEVMLGRQCCFILCGVKSVVYSG